MKISYDEMKTSPLGKKDAAFEEIAMWLELNGMCNAAGVKCLMSCIEKNYRSSNDWFDDGRVSLSVLYSRFDEGPASNRILKNLFGALFKLEVLKKSPEDVKCLASFSMKKAQKLKERCKDLRRKHGQFGGREHHGVLRRLEDLFEVYAEMNDRLEAMMQEQANDNI